LFFGHELAFYRQFIARQRIASLAWSIVTPSISNKILPFNHAHKMVNRAFAAAHGRFVAVDGNGLVREHRIQILPRAARSGHCPSGRFNLPRRNPGAFQSF